MSKCQVCGGEAYKQYAFCKRHYYTNKAREQSTAIVIMLALLLITLYAASKSELISTLGGYSTSLAITMDIAIGAVYLMVIFAALLMTGMLT
ncbi:MAG: hypothetical protein JW834_00955 [Candidatus Diapherotrites archaeon]|nr:hypothetical protein [Candidatus Diapherotrites archaeon]